MKIRHLTLIGWYLVIIFLVIITIIISISCTGNTKARLYGDTTNVTLPRGQKLMEVIWDKNNSLWYLTEPMDSDYSPKTKIFKKISRFGAFEGTIDFIERR